MFIVSSDLSEAQKREIHKFPFPLENNVPAYTFEVVRTVFVEFLCKRKISMKSPSLRVTGHGGSNEQNLHRVEECSENDLAQWATDEITGEQGNIVMRNHAFGHWTTMTMPGSQDHSTAAR